MQGFTRRKFLRSSVGGAAALAACQAAQNGRAAGPNDQLAVAVVGFNAMGFGHVKELARNPLSRVVALCDIDDRVLDRGKNEVQSLAGNSPRTERDFRTLCDDPAIDAVVIATPHHWHAPIALHAMLAGKDVYLEKPAAHVFREGRLLADAARTHQRVFQHGTQMRSSPIRFEAEEVLKSGILGEIKITKAYNCQDRGYAAPVPDGDAPSEVDYDRWLGPAPLRPFNPNRFHRTWRLFRDYGNGDLGDDGTHDLDMARWALGVDSHPIRVTAHGSNIREPGFREFPDNMIATFAYSDGRLLVYEDRLFAPYGMNGVDSSNVFYGTEGYMVFSRRGFFRTYLGKSEEPGPASGKSGRVGAPVPSHLENFLQCIQSRGQTNASADVAHLTCGLLHLGEIAYRTRTTLEFDPATETITNSPDANALLTKEYRRPYGLPEIA